MVDWEDTNRPEETEPAAETEQAAEFEIAEESVTGEEAVPEEDKAFPAETVSAEENASEEKKKEPDKQMNWLQKFMSAGKGTGLYYVRETLSFILIVALAFLLATLINMFAFRRSNVIGDSMQQTFQNGDNVFLSKIPYLVSEPKRGDVVIFDHNKNPRTFSVEFKDSVKSNLLVQLFTGKLGKGDMSHEFWIKRVIGVAGDVVEFRDNKVWLNGEVLEEPYVNPEEVPGYSSWEGVRIEVPEGEVFVMGDNRNHSTDGRFIGTIPVDCILGKVLGNH